MFAPTDTNDAIPQGTPLTSAEREHFLRRGFVKLPQALPSEKVEAWLESTERRIRTDPGRYVFECKTARQRRALEQFRMKSNGVGLRGRWTVDSEDIVPTWEISPRAWGGTTDLLGGSEAVRTQTWSEFTIIGQPVARFMPRRVARALRRRLGWHVDHPRTDATADNWSLGLVIVVILTDVEPDQGATMIAPGSVPLLAQQLRESREPIDMTARPYGHSVMRGCSEIVELTGRGGDVYLLHPFMLHAASKQRTPHVRAIANPCIELNSPLQIRPSAGGPSSLIEQALDSVSEYS